MNPSRITIRGQHMKTVWSSFMTFAMAILFSATAVAQAPAAAGGAPPPQPADYLTGLVGRIALYPDDLVAIILPAATSPLQIVQADRYLDKRKSDPKLPIDDKWDDPVKSLLNYPDVVKMMSNDLDWTSDLGEAVVEDQGAVLEAVQVFRRQAQAAGNLKSDTKQVVKQESEVIIIEPAERRERVVAGQEVERGLLHLARDWIGRARRVQAYSIPRTTSALRCAASVSSGCTGFINAAFGRRFPFSVGASAMFPAIL